MKTQKNTQNHKKRKEKIMKTIKSRNLRAIGIIAVLFLTLSSPIQAQDNETTFPSYIPIAGQAEGVAVDKDGNVYVSVRASSDQVLKFSSSGVRTLLADLGEPGGGACGMGLDTAGNLYVCRAMTNQGVYKVDTDGEVILLSGTEQIVFPNALAFDHQEALYITETFSGDISSGLFGQGGIWRIVKGGTAELWLRDELLTGLPPSFFPFPVGANGIGFHHGDLYVINTDKALVVRVPVRPDGSPGQPEVWKEVEDVPESPLYNSSSFPVMLDGLALDVRGNVYIAVVSRNAIVRINADDRSQETVALHPAVPLDSPASLAFEPDNVEWESLFVTNLGMFQDFIPDQPWPGPGLVKINLQQSLGLEWSPVGTWIMTVPTPMGNMIIKSTWVAQDAAKKRLTGEFEQINTYPVLIDVYPDSEQVKFAGGLAVKTGLNKYEGTFIEYFTKTAGPSLEEIVGIGIVAGTFELVGPDLVQGQGTGAYYMPEQDADQDGFPDQGQEPAVCVPWEWTAKRLTMMPGCVPTPLPE